jgi:hypothetical protein
VLLGFRVRAVAGQRHRPAGVRGIGERLGDDQFAGRGSSSISAAYSLSPADFSVSVNPSQTARDAGLL